MTKFPANVLNSGPTTFVHAPQRITHEDYIHQSNSSPGVDAITSDETATSSRGRKMYTQIKIDEITNLGAVKIRLRSLLSAIAQKGVANGK